MQRAFESETNRIIKKGRSRYPIAALFGLICLCSIGIALWWFIKSGRAASVFSSTSAATVVQSTISAVPTKAAQNPLPTAPRITLSAEEMKKEAARIEASRKERIDREKQEKVAQDKIDNEIVDFAGDAYKKKKQLLTKQEIQLLVEMNGWLNRKEIVKVHLPSIQYPDQMSPNSFVFHHFDIINKEAYLRYLAFLGDHDQDCKNYLEWLRPKNFKPDYLKQQFMLLTLEERFLLDQSGNDFLAAERKPGNMRTDELRKFVLNNLEMFDIKK